jgi:hypothetical protein
VKGKSHNGLQIERKLEDNGSGDDDVCVQDNDIHDIPPPIPLDDDAPKIAYEVIKILDVGREGKKREMAPCFLKFYSKVEKPLGSQFGAFWGERSMRC